MKILMTAMICLLAGALSAQVVGWTPSDPNLPTATIGEPYSVQFTYTPQNGETVLSYEVEAGSGSVGTVNDLPPGLTLAPSGLLSGTPTTENTGYNWEIRANLSGGTSSHVQVIYFLAVVPKSSSSGGSSSSSGGCTASSRQSHLGGIGWVLSALAIALLASVRFRRNAGIRSKRKVGYVGLARWTLPVCLLATMSLTGCASGPKPIPRLEVKAETYDAGFDRTWDALSDVLSEQRYPIRAFEKESGLVTTDFVNSGSRYHYWGKKDDAGREISTWAQKTRYFLNVRVRAIGENKTTVDVIPRFEYMSYAYDADLGRSVETGWRQSDSHGDIEREVHDALAAKLNR